MYFSNIRRMRLLTGAATGLSNSESYSNVSVFWTYRFSTILMHHDNNDNNNQQSGPGLIRGTQVTPTSKPAATVVRRNGFVAEIIVSHDRFPQIYHYVVQRENSTGIIYWGQEVSHQRAMECVEDFLSQYDAKQA